MSTDPTLDRRSEPAAVQVEANATRGAEQPHPPDTSRGAVAPVQNIVNPLDERIATMRNEIDALQVVVAERSSPWYQKPATLVSLIALLFSFGTTYYSNRRAEEADVQTRKQQLSGILQRLTTIPKENVESGKKYADDPAALGNLGTIYQQEHSLLTRQAVDIATHLPAGAVPAIEYYGIGVSLPNGI